MKIQKTTFNPEAVKAMGFELFKKTYAKILRGDLATHYEVITGEKVKKIKEVKEAKEDKVD